MKYLLILLFSTQALCSEFDVDKYLAKTYVTIGAGYKFSETDLYHEGVKWNDPVSARIEIGYYYNKNIKFGISHHSQWLTGFPFDSNKNEYDKTEIFIDYTFTLDFK